MTNLPIQDVHQTYHPPHLDVGEGPGEVVDSLLTVEVWTDQQEVDGGVGVVEGSALQAAQLQGTQVRLAGLHQPDDLLLGDLL